MSNVEKSTILVQKENELLTLQQKKKKVMTQLKRNTTILDKLKVEIVQIQQQMSNMPDLLMELQKVKEEVGDLFRKVKHTDTIPEEEKEGIDEIIEGFDSVNFFEEMMGVSQEEFERVREEKRGEHHTDEFDRQRAFDAFEMFQPEVKETDQREIRKVYVQLATRFHPDKAKSKREKERFHQLMQELNTAYEQHDLAKLLQMRDEYQDEKTLMEHGMTQENPQVDVVESAIARIQKELQLLNVQLKRLKKEIKAIRASDMGGLHKAEKQAARYGQADTNDMMDELLEQKNYLEMVRDGLNSYIETGEMPEILQDMFISVTFDDPFLMEDDFEEISVEDILEAFNAMAEMMEEEANKKKRRKRRR